MNAPHIIFDRKLLRSRQRRAAKRGAEKFLLDRAAEELLDRLAAITRQFSRIALIETPDAETLQQKLLATGRFESIDILAIDDSTEMIEGAKGAQYDLAISLLSTWGFARVERWARRGDPPRVAGAR